MTKAIPRKATGPRRAPAAAPVRERILDAALAVLRQDGIQRLTQVEVAKRAGVRQSHLTYYFPSRTDLLDAIAARFVDGLTAGIGHAGGQARDPGTALAHLAKAIADPGHMRMFIGIIVEADQDPATRDLLLRGTARMEAALAEILGGADQRARARAMLASLWGLGLYTFVVRPAARHDPARAVLAWLEAHRKEKAS